MHANQAASFPAEEEEEEEEAVVVAEEERECDQSARSVSSAWVAMAGDNGGVPVVFPPRFSRAPPGS